VKSHDPSDCPPSSLPFQLGKAESLYHQSSLIRVLLCGSKTKPRGHFKRKEKKKSKVLLVKNAPNCANAQMHHVTNKKIVKVLKKANRKRKRGRRFLLHL
jgi:hypothetical protein